MTMSSATGSWSKPDDNKDTVLQRRAANDRPAPEGAGIGHGDLEMTNAAEDPITLAVIQSGLSAAADEMFSMLRKTAMSPIIHEVLDVGTGVTDGAGNIVGSGAGIPSFVGVLDKAVRRIIEIHGAENIRDGDLFVTNDPNFGGVTHLSDVVIAQPVFFECSCVAWTASIAHWSDIGGMTPGSMSTRATEIYQEGLRLPAVRLFERGQEISAVFEIIAANSRLPDFALGDLWSQIAASRRAGSRIRRLASAYGIDAYEAAIEALFLEGERRARAGLSALPQGEFRIEDEKDSGIVWRATIRISDAEFVVDLRENPDQRDGPWNTSRDGSVISAQMIFKAMTDPEFPANEGSFRPLTVLTRAGSIFDSISPAPHGYYFETRIGLYDMLWRCLASIMPGSLPAGHFASICGTVVAGKHPDTGRRFTMVEPQMGGWGATAERDGENCMYSTSHGETFNCPVEICEARYGLEVAWKRMRDDKSGNGIHKGGKGMSLCYRPRAPAVVAAGFSRHRKSVWGLNGGAPGGTNRLRLVRASGTEESHAFVSDLEVGPGDELIIETANGGGWGAPTGN